MYEIDSKLAYTCGAYPKIFVSIERVAKKFWDKLNVLQNRSFEILYIFLL